MSPGNCKRSGMLQPCGPLFHMQPPSNIQLIGEEVAIAWADGAESFIRQDLLRRASPSAETQGERDVFGNQYGGAGGADHRGVRVLTWEQVGNYAIRFDFSDGHRTGLYTYDYLRKLGAVTPS
jgi:DUF971 family protein